MKKTLSFLFFLLSSITLPAQVNLDSLAHVCEVFKGINSDSLSVNSRLGIRLAGDTKNDAMLATFCRYAGISCFQQQKQDSASYYLDRALDMSLKMKNRVEEAAVYLAMGYMHGTRADTASKIEYMLKALSLFEEQGDKDKLIEASLGIGTAYRMTGNHEMALRYLNRAKDNMEGSTNAFLNSLTFFELGIVEPDMEKAIEYELKSIEFARIANNKGLENLGNQALAAKYISVQNYDKALAHALECHRIGMEVGAKSYVFSALTMLSNIYRWQGNYVECDRVGREAWAIDSLLVGESRSLAQNIAISNIHLKNVDRAVEFFDKYDQLNDKFTEESYHKQIVEMEAKYEAEKKEMRISVLEEERRLHIGLGITIVAVLLLGLGFLLYYHRSKRRIAEQQIRQLEQEKELIAARSALEAEKGEREIIARDLHDGVGAMLSVVKNNMSMVKSYSIIENKEVDYFNKALDGLDTSITELRRVAHHIMPAALLEKGLVTALDDFCRSVPEAEFHFIGSDCRFDSGKELVLYRCVYELVNNSLRHANASRIDVHLNLANETIYLSVVDDGCGFELQKVSMGMGINNIRTRLSAFGGQMDIYSAPGEGTEVNIELSIAGE